MTPHKELPDQPGTFGVGWLVGGAVYEYNGKPSFQRHRNHVCHSHLSVNCYPIKLHVLDYTITDSVIDSLTEFSSLLLPPLDMCVSHSTLWNV